VHWEWPRGAESWGLTEVVRFQKRFNLKLAKLDGCQVGARDENGNLAYKSWTIMTSCPLMEPRVSLKCPKNHPHAQLEGSAVTRSAYYLEPMARRIVDVILTSG
jgi:hypothetical protein